jgi:hypothetical protein
MVAGTLSVFGERHMKKWARIIPNFSRADTLVLADGGRPDEQNMNVDDKCKKRLTNQYVNGLKKHQLFGVR